MRPGDPSPAAIVIGASVGAIEALLQILPELPRDFSLPVLVVVHVPPTGKRRLSELFTNRCQMAVKDGEDKEVIQSGTIYFAPAGYHLLVEPDFSLSLSSDEPVLYSRPSIDVLFESAADAYGDGLTGVILTGANSDGARGLAAVHAGGGETLVQNPHTAEGRAMPQAALRACPDALTISLEQIAATLKLKSLSP
jgi:two-component system chemotaxis response regulator CheB